MSKNMVERVARAIAEPIMRKFDGWHPEEPVVWERLPERDRGALCSIANAAIEAMRSHMAVEYGPDDHVAAVFYDMHAALKP